MMGLNDGCGMPGCCVVEELAFWLALDRVRWNGSAGVGVFTNTVLVFRGVGRGVANWEIGAWALDWIGVSSVRCREFVERGVGDALRLVVAEVRERFSERR